MSGKKRVTIDSAEYRHLRQAAERLSDVRRDMPELLDEVLRKTRDDLRRSMEQVDARQRKFERDVRKLGDEAAALAADLEGLIQDKARATAAARHWIGDARALIGQIDESLPHDRFAPGRLAQLSARLIVAENNLSSQLPEPAVAIAQDVNAELGDLQKTVQLLDREWRQAHGDAREKLLAVQLCITANETLPAADPSGNEMPGVLLDIDWWSHGKLAGLAAEVDGLLARVGDETSEMTTKELRRIAESEGDALEERRVAIVRRARGEALASQARYEAACDAMAVLAKNGYVREPDTTYAGGDERGAYLAKVRHLDGSEVVIQVIPSAPAHEGDLPGQVITWDYFGTRAEDVRLAMMRDLHDQLKAGGLAVSEPEQVSPRPDPALRDFAKLRKPDAAAARGVGQ